MELTKRDNEMIELFKSLTYWQKELAINILKNLKAQQDKELAQ